MHGHTYIKCLSIYFDINQKHGELGVTVQKKWPCNQDKVECNQWMAQQYYCFV